VSSTGVSALAPEQRTRFERDGFLVLDDTGCDEDVLAGIVSDLDGLYEGDGEKRNGVFYHSRRIQDAWRISDNVRALALSARIREVLAALYGREPLAFQTLNFRIGTEQAVHSDAIHFNSQPAGFMCGVWVALEDIDSERGPVVFYPGSHRLPFLTMADAGLEASESSYGAYEEHVARLIADRRLEPRYGTLQKGQALVWAANLLHGGAPQRDRSLSRHSQVTHYFFEGCRYWAPMVSEGDDVRWREPRWIA
jgi:ectoine hydroxylase-related dioxygenase (phytanoyl-CoA dioxygenase family)